MPVLQKKISPSKRTCASVLFKKVWHLCLSVKENEVWPLCLWVIMKEVCFIHAYCILKSWMKRYTPLVFVTRELCKKQAAKKIHCAALAMVKLSFSSKCNIKLHHTWAGGIYYLWNVITLTFDADTLQKAAKYNELYKPSKRSLNVSLCVWSSWMMYDTPEETCFVLGWISAFTWSNKCKSFWSK